jgi:hypothetical protein
MAAPRIFVSMGTPYSDRYLQFRDELETFLRNSCKVDPRIIGKSDYPDGSPLEKVRDVMRDCHGVIVVAYERKYLQAGVEKRGGKAPITLQDRAYTTPWNHIESAMAFSLGLPLYVICENGLSEEGLIESKLDWYVQYMDISRSELSKTEYADSIRAWVEKRVVPRSKRPRFLSALQGKLRLSEMTGGEYMSVIGIFSTVFLIGAAVAKWLPGLLVAKP